MSTLEALNAISEAIQAHAKLPEVEAKLKDIQEIADFRQLELDEAHQTIDSLRQTIAELKNELTELHSTIADRNTTIGDLRDRNDNLQTSLDELATAHSNTLHTLDERDLQIESLRLTKASLEERLADSRSYGERLAATLKSIGQSIVNAVAEPEPEVSNPSTFRDSVAVSDPASTELASSNNPEPVPTLVEPTGPVLVNHDNLERSPGCYTYIG